MSREFNPSRLRFARSCAGLSRAKLARLVDVAPRTLANYEDGTYEPPMGTIEALAHELNVPGGFFFGDDLADIEPGAVSFRALSKMSATTRDAAIGSGVLATQIARWLDERLHLPPVDVPTYARQVDPTTAAERVRSEWDMGYAKIRNAVHLLEAHGVRVFSLPEHLVDVDAFSFWFDHQPYAVLNTRKSAERIRFDAMHELGHLVMHADYDMPDSRERELHANRFAAAMLMPADDVLASRLRGAGVERVLEARHRWGVSAMALTHRIHELGLTTDWVYTSTCRRLSQLGYRSSEPGGMGAVETSQVLEKSLQMLRARGITQGDIAREIDLHPARLRELLFGLALTPVDGQAQGGIGARAPDLTLFQGGG